MLKRTWVLGAGVVTLNLWACDIYQSDTLTSAKVDAETGDSGQETQTDDTRGDGPSGTGSESPGATGGASQDSSPAFWEGTNPCPAGTRCGPSGDGCESAGLPGPSHRPGKIHEDDGETAGTFYFGLTKIRVGAVQDDDALTPTPPDQPAWRDIGFDVDGLCTGSEGCAYEDGKLVKEVGCQRPGVLLASDGTGCRDNLVGSLFTVGSNTPKLAEGFGFSERHFNCNIRAGWFNIIGKVSGYNGKSDDPLVRVDLYNSLGVDAPTFDCDGGPDGLVQENWYLEPAIPPDVPWQILRRSLNPAGGDAQYGADLPDGKVADPAAFVRDGWLIAEIPDGSELWLNGLRSRSTTGVRLILNRAILAAKLVFTERDIWEVPHGTIAAVISRDDALGAFQQIGVCENMCAEYRLLLTYIENNGDALVGSRERLSSVPCDGLTFGMEFTATQVATSADKIVEVPAPEVCPDPANPELPRQGTPCD